MAEKEIKLLLRAIIRSDRYYRQCYVLNRVQIKHRKNITVRTANIVYYN